MKLLLSIRVVTKITEKYVEKDFKKFMTFNINKNLRKEGKFYYTVSI